MQPKKSEGFWNVVHFDLKQGTHVVFGHDMLKEDAEDAVNELREQRVPALCGKQTAEHSGSYKSCNRCKAMMKVMADRIKAPRASAAGSGRRPRSREIYSQDGE